MESSLAGVEGILCDQSIAVIRGPRGSGDRVPRGKPQGETESIIAMGRVQLTQYTRRLGTRDMLVRRAATSTFGQAAFGRIYGFVYSGIDVGLACAPLAFGPLMDAGRYSHVLWGVAALQTLAIATALTVGSKSRT